MLVDKKKSFVRITALFLCFIMIFSLFIQIYPTNLFSNSVNAEEVGIGKYTWNKNCTNSETGIHIPCPSQYCLDIGYGQCLPLAKLNVKLKNNDTYIDLYLYELDTGYNIRTNIMDKGATVISGDYGQYFYWPVKWKNTYSMDGLDWPVDISDLSQLGDITEAAKIPSNRINTPSVGWTSGDYGEFFLGGDDHRNYPVRGVANLHFTNFKSLESSNPLNYWVADFSESQKRAGLFLNYNGIKVAPRWVMNEVGNALSYVAYPSDTWINSHNKKAIYEPGTTISLPGDNPNFKFGRGNVNMDFMQKSETGEFEWLPMWENAWSYMTPEEVEFSTSIGAYTNKNSTVQYLDPDKENLPQPMRDKIRALFATVQAYEALYGSADVEISMDEGDLFPKLNSVKNDMNKDRQILRFFKYYLKTEDPSKGWCQPWCPGPLTPKLAEVVPQSYIYASLTAKAVVLMRFFEISGYAGGGGYSTMTTAKTPDAEPKNYASWMLPKFQSDKDLVLWGGLEYDRNIDEDSSFESLYNARMWKPNETYEETWLELQEQGDEKRQEELEKMSWADFQNNFLQISPKTEKQEDGTYSGGLLEYDYPYVWVQTVSMQDKANTSNIGMTFHGNIMTNFGINNLGCLENGAKNSYDRNMEAIYGNGSASDRTTKLFGKNENYSIISPTNTEVKSMGKSINNAESETMGRYVMPGDRDIGEIVSNTPSDVDAILNGGRLFAFNLSPWNGKPANEFNIGATPDGNVVKNEGGTDFRDSDEIHKVVNANIYRTVCRTPKVEDLWGSAKPTKTNPAFIAVSGMIDVGGDTNWYQTLGDTDGSNEKMRALARIGVPAKGEKYKTYSKFNDNANLNTDSATVVYMMGDASDNKRNLVLYQAVVKDENGQVVATIDSKPDDNTYYVQLPDLNPQDIKDGKAKNYYVEWQMKYENLNPKKPPTKSFETDLGTIGYYKQNIKGFNDSNGENYETSTNLKSYWDIINGLDIGKYDSSVYAKGYNQETSSYDNRVVPMAELAKLALENKQKVATADYIIQIPRKYDNKDNTNLSDWETLKIHFEQKVGTLTDPDNAVTKITLTCYKHKEVFVGDPNTLVRIHQGCTYDAEITVTRVGGIGETNLNPGDLTAFDGSTGHGQNNSLEIRGYEGTVPIGKEDFGGLERDYFKYGIYDSSKTNCSGNLKRIGDYATFKLLNLKPTDTGYIEINAFFNPVDIAQDNNYMTARFGGASDFVLENLEISQDVINLPPNQSQTTEVRVRFSAEIGLNYDKESDPNGQKDPTLSPTKVAVLMFEKGLNDFTYNQNSYRVVYQDNDVKLSPNSGPIQISGTLGYGASPQSEGSPIAFKKDSSYRFIAVINGGNSTANGNLGGSMTHRFPQFQTFFYETDNHNNESQHELTVIPAPCSGGDCDIKPYCWDKKNGLCGKAHTKNSWTVTFYYTECPIAVYYTCCSGKPTTCRTCCRGEGCHSWTTAKTFTETFEIQGWFRSVDTNEQWVRASSNAAVVRAGHWFDFKAVTIYNTNRADMPPPDPYGGCAWLSRSPGYSQPSAYRWVRIVMDNPTGGQKKIYNSFKSGWTQEFMPQRYTVPESTKNLTITFTVDVDEFKGYWVDKEHPKVELCDCTTYTMKVQNPLPIIDGTNLIS